MLSFISINIHTLLQIHPAHRFPLAGCNSLLVRDAYAFTEQFLHPFPYSVRKGQLTLSGKNFSCRINTIKVEPDYCRISLYQLLFRCLLGR